MVIMVVWFWFWLLIDCRVLLALLLLLLLLLRHGHLVGLLSSRCPCNSSISSSIRHVPIKMNHLIGVSRQRVHVQTETDED